MEKGLKNLQNAGRRSLKVNPSSPHSHHSQDDFNDSGFKDEENQNGANDGGENEQAPYSGGAHPKSSSGVPPASGPTSASTNYHYSSGSMSSSNGGHFSFSPAPLTGLQNYQTLPDFRTSFENSSIPSIESMLHRPISMMMHS